MIGLPPLPAAETEESGAESAPLSFRGRVWRSLRRDPSFWIGAVLVGGVVLAALLAPLLAPHDPNTQFDDGITTLGEPLGHTAKFPLGTDFEGRDLLSRLLYGARLSLTISLLGNGLAVALGVLLGASAGWWRGWAERLIMRATDVMLAFPSLLLALALVGIEGPSLTIIIVVIGMVSWTAVCRVTYGQVLALREREWIDAARATGIGSLRILLRHILPHLTAPIAVYATLGIALTVVFEGSLAYLGLGVPPPTASWGRMIHDAADPNALLYYWLLLFPALALLLTVLGFNFLGDALRDALDPRER
ncbi:MAG TPA: ABC transporter permease [Chloroflexota bacterium]|nr:ABC transporter permease [Chloroflexota bacterium]